MSRTPPLRVLLTGATGFVGAALAPALVARGFDVIQASRRPERAAQTHGGGKWIAYDANVKRSVEAAVRDIDVVVYLVHAMSDGKGYAEREHDSAFLLREACAAAGVKRILYLGGVEPRAHPSRHLASRLATGRVLREGRVPTWELRAGMIVGDGSQSWQICRDLAMRLPLMVLPAWLQSRSRPVAIEDVVRALSLAVDLPDQGPQLFDLGGPDVMSAANILFAIARLHGMRPITVPVPLLTPRLSSHWLRIVSGADIAVARELVDGLRHDLLPTQPSFFDHVGHTPRGFEEAASDALAAYRPDRRTAAIEGVVRWLARNAPATT
ncbi:MAG: NAD(P)H-binding protein [Myxococcales bacterium]|nr:NAD(P)H-binding protein [Myxococcales bacterium]